MVFPDIEEAVRPEPERLVNLEVEADRFHGVKISSVQIILDN
jgi:hypothetical protein